MWMCIAGLVLAVSGVTCAEDIKQIRPTGYVTDLAAVLKPQAKSQLEAMCTELEQKTGAEMAIVTVKSLDGNEIQPYANDLFQKLGVGKKKADNGVMLLVAPNDRKYWTEVGYGLEPIINDARAGDAGRLMVPYFRQGDYGSGITAAAWQLAKFIADDKGVTLSGATVSASGPTSRRGRSSMTPLTCAASRWSARRRAWGAISGKRSTDRVNDSGDAERRRSEAMTR